MTRLVRRAYYGSRFYAARRTWAHYRREPLRERIAAARASYSAGLICEPRHWSP